MSQKIRVGISIGDYNGIGPEVILKTLSDSRVLEFCIPVIYGSTRVINYHKKQLGLANFQMHSISDLDELNPKQINLVNCWDDESLINLGQPSIEAAKYALVSLDRMIADGSNGKLDAMVTAPLNKKTVAQNLSGFTGHTEYFTQAFGSDESMMLMISHRVRVGLVTNHVPVKEIADRISTKLINRKLEILNSSLQKDFLIEKPKIAVLGLNPHAGDSGTLGMEEEDLIVPAIERARESAILAFGPYPADGFFGSGHYTKFDAVLAMYHDQGLAPFKLLTFNAGVNFTAGLPVVRTSPDHGTAYDMAGKGEARPDSFRESIFLARDIFLNCKAYYEMTANPVPKLKMRSERP